MSLAHLVGSGLIALVLILSATAALYWLTLRYAAEECMGKPSASLRAHNNQIGPLFFREINDAVRGRSNQRLHAAWRLLRRVFQLI